MATFDISPLFKPTSIGFDRAWNELSSAMAISSSTWPAYDILRIDDEEFRITLAVPGFSDSDLTLETREGSLWVKGHRQQDLQHNQYLYRGIDRQEFQRTFKLPEHVKVKGARLEAGMLHIDLYRDLPEALRPRRIEVVSDNSMPRAIESSSKAA